MSAQLHQCDLGERRERGPIWSLVIHGHSGGVEIVIPAKIVNKWTDKHGVRSVGVIAWSASVGGQWPVMAGDC